MECVVGTWAGWAGRTPRPAARSLGLSALRGATASTRPAPDATLWSWRHVVKCTRLRDTVLTHRSSAAQDYPTRCITSTCATMGCARGICTAEKIFIFINIAFAVSIWKNIFNIFLNCLEINTITYFFYYLWLKAGKWLLILLYSSQ